MRVVSKVLQQMENSKSWKQQLISDTPSEWDRRIEGFREHMAIDDSLLAVSGTDAACGWAVVQLDCVKVEEPRYAIYGRMLAELAVQRTVNMAHPWAFTTALAGLTGSSTIHTDSADIFDGLWRGEGCIGPKTYADPCWKNQWELLTECAEK